MIEGGQDDIVINEAVIANANAGLALKAAASINEDILTKSSIDSTVCRKGRKNS
ncbi:Uncharacterised protein [Streptococcus downei MFe28]|uniref:Uncharacterized protein n=1 Tax=Streptococcus downei MFe28 TaxID=764290 RepID=A0A380JGP6_STRDO|nr:Uncharacterised protein [Streptococcus downei MFe28]